MFIEASTKKNRNLFNPIYNFSKKIFFWRDENDAEEIVRQLKLYFEFKAPLLSEFIITDENHLGNLINRVEMGGERSLLYNHETNLETLVSALKRFNLGSKFQNDYHGKWL